MFQRCVKRLLILLPLLFLSACGGGGGQDSPPPPNTPSALSIAVDVSPYASADAALSERETIDWNRDTAKARAITLAYAARELQQHFALVGATAQIVPSVTRDQSAIVLAVASSGVSSGPPVDYDALGDQGYALTRDGNQLYITSRTRVGVLYGTYRFLEQLGFAWYDPAETQTPASKEAVQPSAWPTLLASPRQRLRGFWIFSDQVSDDYAIWMARNRLNLSGKVRPALAHLLGMQGWRTGHELLQQEFSQPGLFEAHPEWYALVNGQRQPIPATGPYFNPAFGNTEAATYFADRMVERLEHGDLQDVDVLNVWPADERSDVFDQSPEAHALGNDTDNLLYFYAVICRSFRDARAAGRLSRPVTLAGISYYLTMQPPTNASVVADLQGADYLHIFYPIQRDWSGAVDADLADHDSNREIVTDVRAWHSIANFEYGLVDYYNLSSYGAVGLSDFVYFGTNYQVLGMGEQGLLAYMHPLRTNPGPRRLTNALLAHVSWQTGASETPLAAAGAVTQKYFDQRYGKDAAEWRKVYELMSQSVENAKELFGMDSLLWVLFQEQFWSLPPYTRAEANTFIPQYRAGGVQNLPGGYSAVPSVRESFRGLDESIALQDQAATRWQAVLNGTLSAEVRARMDSDVAWFKATASRYRLTAATCDYLLAADGSPERAAARSRMEQELAFLETSPVTHDTISPVDQSAFPGYHKKLLGLP